MALWIQKHEPRAMGDLLCHRELNEQLRQIVRSGNIPNLILYGQPGSGRKTRARTFLNEIFGERVHNLKSALIELEGGSKGDIFQISSHCHVEVSAEEMGRKDREVITTLVKKTIGQTSNTFSENKNRFRVVLVKDADHLSWDAQAALRRTVETYHNNCRIIMVCESLSKLMKPLRSRCLCLRVPLPSNDEILEVMKRVALRESFTPKIDYLKELTEVCRRNLERALLLLELAAIQRYPSPKGLSYLPWEMSVVEMTKLVISKPSAQTLINIRNLAYELYASNISMQSVLDLTHRLLMMHLTDSDAQLRLDITQYALKFGEALSSCQNEVVQIEAFFSCAAYAIKKKQLAMSA